LRRRKNDHQSLVNASVLFSASYSETGSSRCLLREAIQGKLEIVITQHVREETERNLAQEAPEALPALHKFQPLSPPSLLRSRL